MKNIETTKELQIGIFLNIDDNFELILYNLINHMLFTELRNELYFELSVLNNELL